LKTIIKELLPPTSPENETAAASEEGEGEEGKVKIAGLLKHFKLKILKPSEELKEADLMERREECSECKQSAVQGAPQEGLQVDVKHQPMESPPSGWARG